MLIRKKQGEADGWVVTECIRSGTGWDDNGEVYQCVKGQVYYTQGKLDPNFFKTSSAEVKTVAKKVKKEEG